MYTPCESANLYIDVYCIILNSVTIDGSPGHIIYIIYRHMYGGFLKWGGGTPNSSISVGFSMK